MHLLGAEVPQILKSVNQSFAFQAAASHLLTYQALPWHK